MDPDLDKLTVKIICSRDWRDGTVIKSTTELPQDLHSILSTHASSLKLCITLVPGDPTPTGLCGHLHAYNAHDLVHTNKPFKEESMSEPNREAQRQNVGTT